MTGKRTFAFLASLTFVVATNLANAAEGDAPATAAAAAPTPDWTFPGSVDIASEYIFRGLTQTNKDPALQGGIEIDHVSGFYAGAWGSNISWLSDLTALGFGKVSSSIELDGYLGYRTKFTDAFGMDFGVYTYYYPGTYPSGFTSPNTTEVYIAASYSFVSLKYSYALTNLFGFANSKYSGYLDLSANWEFTPSWVLNGHVGRQNVEHFGAASYTDWKLGVTKNFSAGWSLALAYYDTNADEAVYTNPYGTFQGRSTGVLTVTKTF
ncbi:MAG TPA: TorF family putative porin [Nevskia sp.]|nr:TorF family putative porin [Nevskia sp.]